MSGSGRRSHYRKSVTNEVYNTFPTPQEGDCIAKIVGSRGTNIFEIEIPVDSNDPTSCVQTELALMPNKFRRLIWIKRGDFLIVTSGIAAAAAIGKAGAGAEVVGTITMADTEELCTVFAGACATATACTSAASEAADKTRNSSKTPAAAAPTPTPAVAKVQYIIKNTLTDEQILHLHSNGLWPGSESGQGLGLGLGQEGAKGGAGAVKSSSAASSSSNSSASASASVAKKEADAGAAGSRGSGPGGRKVRTVAHSNKSRALGPGGKKGAAQRAKNQEHEHEQEKSATVEAAATESEAETDAAAATGRAVEAAAGGEMGLAASADPAGSRASNVTTTTVKESFCIEHILQATQRTKNAYSSSDIMPDFDDGDEDEEEEEVEAETGAGT